MSRRRSTIRSARTLFSSGAFYIVSTVSVPAPNRRTCPFYHLFLTHLRLLSATSQLTAEGVWSRVLTSARQSFSCDFLQCRAAAQSDGEVRSRITPHTCSLRARRPARCDILHIAELALRHASLCIRPCPLMPDRPGERCGSRCSGVFAGSGPTIGPSSSD